ncbi:Nramp family divalent metal transporter [Falsarthrobacter nasiphocae]|uniref:Manganese transport protein n=1 Tax=Falsarthrobacter nasiphocae TaxID=189863 RepID=A0AAE3YI22_9MICC|nr:Nramp family divalent metal transporter [Falsarthrobacter nasiphocae]MDR6892595.1 manganese transport protein [Falsarthrobacter nasiphocae]
MSKSRLILLLGPALVAAVAYVDPGNVAANMASGAQYGYLLVWVLVAANAMAALVQYQSAKLGLVTGGTLPEHIARAVGPRWRWPYWVQAELAIIATDMAEVIGGAVALHILWGVPLWAGGLVMGVFSVLLLLARDARGQRAFEAVIVAMLAVVAAGFLAGLVVSAPAPRDVAAGLVPRFEGVGSVLLAASMLGATVMPHAVYVHSDLALKRHGRIRSRGEGRRLLAATRWDVGLALAVAGAVNIGMLVTAAATLRGVDGVDTLEGAAAAIAEQFGAVVGVMFAVGLLASGLASTVVGAYSGDVVMGGFLGRRVPMWLRRCVSIIPAVGLLWMGADPTAALVLSQAVLSFAVPFALIPLCGFTRSRALMGEYADPRWVAVLAGLGAFLIVALNGALLVLLAAGVE